MGAAVAPAKGRSPLAVAVLQLNAEQWYLGLLSFLLPPLWIHLHGCSTQTKPVGWLLCSWWGLGSPAESHCWPQWLRMNEADLMVLVAVLSGGIAEPNLMCSGIVCLLFSRISQQGQDLKASLFFFLRATSPNVLITPGAGGLGHQISPNMCKRCHEPSQPQPSSLRDGNGDSVKPVPAVGQGSSIPLITSINV